MLLVILFLPLLSYAELIPRKLLFSNTRYSMINLSPDGRFIAFARRDENNIRNIFLKDLSSNETRQVTFEEKNDVLGYTWTSIEDIILYVQDQNGDENHKLFMKNISKEALADDRYKKTTIFDRPGVKAMVLGNSMVDNQILLAVNNENPAYHNVYTYNLITENMTLIFKNNRFGGFIIDNDSKIRLGIELQPDASVVYYRRKPQFSDQMPMTSDASEWERYLVVSANDGVTAALLFFDKSNQYMYWKWSEGSNLDSIVLFHIDDPQHKEIIYTPVNADIDSIFQHFTDCTLLAVSETYHKSEIHVLNDTVKEDFDFLINFRPDDPLTILSANSDMSLLLVTYTSPSKPYSIYLYDSQLKSIKYLFNLRPELEEYTLYKQVGFTFQTRDNLTLQAYISLPLNIPLRTVHDVRPEDMEYAELGMLPAVPQKMVVNVHGGPNTRTYYSFSAANAWLTNRGYSVLQVNFRGSSGFGKELINAGNGEWGRKMHYDILDAVEFAIAKGIANESQIAIMGGSYGGYEVLVALTSSPNVFACGVDIFGPSNLLTLSKSAPPYWKPVFNRFVQMMGFDPRTAVGRQVLRTRSPLFFADQVIKPLMIMQGANDVRVKQQEAEQFVKALQRKSIPVTYILYPDEGHGFVKEANKLSQYGFIEKFLHSCLGGEYEPFYFGQYNSSAIIKANGFVEDL